MTSKDKVEKAKEILKGYPSEEDGFIAVGLARESANDGNAEGLYVMGRLYYEGKYIERDYAKAADFCKQALNAGNEKAKAVLAPLHMVGEILEKDETLALKYLNDCMAKKNGFAYFVMGDFVRQSVFPDKGKTECIGYFEKAIEYGEEWVAVRLAEVYHTLCETSKAEYWYKRAEDAGVHEIEESKAMFTEQNYPQRREKLFNYYFSKGKVDDAIALVDRDAEAGDVSAIFMQAQYCAWGFDGERAYAQNIQKALDIYNYLAAEGHIQAYYELSLMYENIEEIKDHQKSFDYAVKAAQAGHPDALFLVATRFYEAKDFDSSKEWMEKAARQNSPQALYVLAINHVTDDGMKGGLKYIFDYPKNDEKGVELMLKAADAGSSLALYWVALWHGSGTFLERDDKKAFQLMCDSFDLDHDSWVAKMIGDCYCNGKGVEQNYEAAVSFYKWAADDGESQAACSLAYLYYTGADGAVEKNYDEAISLLQPFLDSGDRDVYYGMASVFDSKCREVNGYSWNLLQQALGFLQKIADSGDVDAMGSLAEWCLRGKGILGGLEETKYWLRKYADNGGDVSNLKCPVFRSDESFEKEVMHIRILYWKEVVDLNIDRVEHPLEMLSSDGNCIVDNILQNMIKLGEPNARQLFMSRKGIGERNILSFLDRLKKGLGIIFGK